MSRPMKFCDQNLLRRSLNDSLSEAEEELLSAHLCECNACQTELETLAGHPTAWRQVGTTLKAAHSSVTLAASDVSSDRQAEEYDAAIDFSVEYLEPSSAPDSIGCLGDIEIQEVIGHGGMGVVLKGFQPELKRLVAVKVLAPQLSVGAASRKRFAREAQATAAILHPNVMPILSVNSSGRLPYIVMPFVPCESLQQRIDRTGQMELLDILRIGMQTANGLAAAHAQGLVHRDVKPANILLESGVEKVMLTDFGLARAIDDSSITRTGVIAGTPLYMSPEQSRGEAVDARSDLFSLGSVLYTLATGRMPFRAESTYGILRRLTDEKHRPLREISPELPGWLEMIVNKLLAKHPSDRFASASEVASLLEGCIAHLQQPTTVSLPPECAAYDRRSPAGLWLTVVVAAIVVAAGMWGLSGGSQSDDRLSREKAKPGIAPKSLSEVQHELLRRSVGSDEHDIPDDSLEIYTDWNTSVDEISSLKNDFEQWHNGTSDSWPDGPTALP